jgi:hypothetical protein
VSIGSPSRCGAVHTTVGSSQWPVAIVTIELDEIAQLRTVAVDAGPEEPHRECRPRGRPRRWISPEAAAVSSYSRSRTTANCHVRFERVFSAFLRRSLRSAPASLSSPAHRPPASWRPGDRGAL